MCMMALFCYLDTVLVPIQHVIVEYEPPPPEHRALCVQHTIALLVQIACHIHNIETELACYYTDEGDVITVVHHTV